MSEAMAPGGRRRRMARPDRAAQLVEIAERLITERGVVGTSMEDVAEAAGVTKPVVYDHFGSKDGLLCALIARAADELHRRTAIAVEGVADPYESLRRGLEAYFQTMDRRDGIWWALLDATAAVSPATLAAVDAARDRQAGWIAELIALQLPDGGRRPADRERALIYAHVVVGACERLAALRVQQRSLSVRAVTEHVLDVLWRGFAQLLADATA